MTEKQARNYDFFFIEILDSLLPNRFFRDEVYGNTAGKCNKSV